MGTISAVSLGVEKKHKADQEATQIVKVRSSATCSRNGILEGFRLGRARAIEQNVRDMAVVKKTPKMNSWALAVRERPDLFPRARGKLYWENDVSEEDMQQWTRIGDHTALKAYHEEHKDRLAEHAHFLVEQAKIISKKVRACPLSSVQLVKLLGDNPKHFHALMRTAPSSCRLLNKRVEPLSSKI